MAKKLNQLPKYNIWEGSEDNRIDIEVKGLGWVSLNRTSEGLIIDVTDGEDVVSSLGLMDSDFTENKAEDGCNVN